MLLRNNKDYDFSEGSISSIEIEIPLPYSSFLDGFTLIK
jgi:hypothetical protein